MVSGARANELSISGWFPTLSGCLIGRRPILRVALETVERGHEKRAVVRFHIELEGPEAPDLAVDSLAFALGSGDDVAGRRARLGDDHVSLAAGLRADVVGHPLGREERSPKRPLDLFLPRQLVLDLLQLVAEIAALAPHVLEARDDVREQLVGRLAVVAERPATQLDVPNLDRRERHLNQALRRRGEKSFWD